MEVLCYALASALLVLTDDALSRDIAALMAYGREEEEENAV